VTYLIVCATIFSPLQNFLSTRCFSLFWVLGLLFNQKSGWQTFFFVARPNENVAYFNRIAQRHLDFLVCDSATMKPLLGVELDDSSHQRDSRQERDEFVDKVFQAACFPLLRFSAQREYNGREIAERIAPFLKDKMVSTPPSQAPSMPPTVAHDNAAPLCPKCNIPMVIRTVAQGEHKGKQFYGCPNYPRCREVKPLAIRKAG